jgi:SAM-dependent MidA family methyltransferase
MTNSLEIQKPVSRSESIRKQFSDHSWRWCFSNFFVENIPFSGRSGQVFANKLVVMFIELLKNSFNISTSDENFDKPFHIYEFGAGMGLLSKHFLDILQKKYPNIYNNTTVCVTDSSPEMIKKLQTISLFYDHVERVRFEVIDSKTFEIENDKKPIFAYSSYLLTSLPSHHIEISNGEINELLIKTSIDDDAVIIDTTQYPPKSLAAPEIKSLLNDSDKEILRILAPKIEPLLKEDIVSVNINDSNNLDSTAKDNLKTFANTLQANDTIRFNYSPDIHSHIESIFNSLLDKGVYIISDFGYTQTYGPTPEVLVKPYGVTLYSSVCFPYLLSITNKKNVSSWFTNREPDLTQELIFQKNSNPDNLNKAATEFIKNCGTENISIVLKKLSELDNSENYLPEFQTIVSGLTSEEEQDYAFLKTAAALLLTNGYDKQAYEYALKLLNSYGELAIDAYSILGIICQRQGFLEEALECYEKIPTICENDSGAYESCSSVQLRLGNQTEASDILKNALRYSRNNAVWHLAVGIGAIQQELGNVNEAIQALQWPIDIAEKHPSLIPDTIITKFKAKVTTLQ